MRYLMLILILFHFSLAFADGRDVEYQVGGDTFEGYFITQQSSQPLVLLVHDWDGVTDYEKRRASMLNELGYAVFAIDLFGKDVRPTAVAEKENLPRLFIVTASVCEVYSMVVWLLQNNSELMSTIQ